MNSRPWVVAASAIGVAVTLVWLARSGSEAGAPEDAATPVVRLQEASPDDVPSREPHADAPKVAPAPAPAQGTDTPRSVNTPPARPSSPLPGEAPTPSAFLVAKKGFPASITNNDRQFADEPIDWSWAPGAEAEILGKLAQQPIAGVRDLRVHCRITTCRLEALVSGDATSPPPMRNFKAAELTPRLVLFATDAAGAVSLVAYFPRADQP